MPPSPSDDPTSPAAPRSAAQGDPATSSSGPNPPEPPLTLLYPTSPHSTTFPTDSSTSRPRRRASSASHHSPPEGFRALPRHANPANPPEPPLTLLHPATSRLSPTRESYRDRELSHGGAGRLPLGHANKRRRSRYASLFAGVGSGMWNDIKGRAPWYLSDWTDAWNYRVIPSTWVGS
jgi:hypothetical protein